jgi:hypothetical protein
MSLAESVGAKGWLSDLISGPGGPVGLHIPPGIRLRITSIMKMQKTIMMRGKIHHPPNAKQGPW